MSLGFILLAILFVYLSSVIFKYIVYKVFFSNTLPPQPAHSPYGLPDIGGALNDAGQMLKAFWEKILIFLHLGGSSASI